MNGIPDGLYLKNIESGEYFPTGGGCDVDKAEIPEGYALFSHKQGEWEEVVKRQPDPFLLKLHRLQESLFHVAHQLETLTNDYESRGH